MEPTIVLTSLLTILAIVPDLWGGATQTATQIEVPDLCAEAVYLDADNVPLEDTDGTQLSKYCTWTGDDAPVWADEVCCELGPDSAYCTPTNTNGECSPVQVKRWCDFAEFDGEKVECMQPFTSACEAGVCKAPAVGTETKASAVLCCFGGSCYEVSVAVGCGGHYLQCDSPYTNEDGTVGCAD